MARTRTWTARAAEVERERTRQVSRHGNTLNQIPRRANTHKGAAEAVEALRGNPEMVAAVAEGLADEALAVVEGARGRRRR